MLRKIGSYLLMVLAVLGLLICIAGIAGSWFGKRQIDQITAGALATVDDYLNSATGVLSRVGEILDRASGGVEQVQSATQAAVAAGQAPAVEVLSAVIGEEIVASTASVGPLVESAMDSVKAVNEALMALNRFPGVNVPVYTEQIANLEEHVDSVQTRIGAVRSAIQESDGEAILRVTGELEGALDEAQASLDESSTRVADTRQSLNQLNEAFPGYTLWGALGLTFFLLLMAVGQCSLIADCWRWART